jgi:hypothetical protein
MTYHLRRCMVCGIVLTGKNERQLRFCKKHDTNKKRKKNFKDNFRPNSDW